MPFDTLQAAKRLEAAGVETRQAEAMVDTMSSVFGNELATKADIQEVRGDIRVLQWMFGTLVVLNISILIKLLIAP